jgi:hypothetical protein
MNKDQELTFFGYHVVCLIDVLGQKEKLAAWPEMPGKGEITPEFLKALKETVGTVLAFRDHFDSLFEQLNKRALPPQLVAMPKKQQEIYRRVADCSVRVERFSDTFVFSSRIGNSQKESSVTPMYSILAACCMAMLVSLAGKTPVRGAITVGLGAELEDKSFYGPALAEAHYLESKIADYPRVVVSPSALEFVARGQKYATNPKAAMAMDAIAGACRSLICKDADGHHIVDFLGKGLREILPTATQFDSAVRAANDFVRQEVIRFQGSGNSTLAGRYAILQQYLDSRLPIWGLNPADNG